MSAAQLLRLAAVRAVVLFAVAAVLVVLGNSRNADVVTWPGWCAAGAGCPGPASTGNPSTYQPTNHLPTSER